MEIKEVERYIKVLKSQKQDGQIKKEKEQFLKEIEYLVSLNNQNQTIEETEKVKVTFYMKSGNVIVMRFDWFKIDRLTGDLGHREMSYDGAEDTFTLDIRELECVVIKDPNK